MSIYLKNNELDVEKYTNISFYSNNYSILYTAVAKVGCTTLKKWFTLIEHIDYDKYKNQFSEEVGSDLFVHDVLESWNHANRSEIVKSYTHALQEEKVFKFSLTRNPYSRIFSAWQSKILLEEPLQISQFPLDFRQVFIRNSLDVAQAFEKFLEYLIQLRNIENIHWMPQCLQILPMHIKYDFIGKLEELEKFTARLQAHCESIKKPFVNPFEYRENTTLLPLQECYLTQRSIEIIKILYRDDFALFEYDTDCTQYVKNPLELEQEQMLLHFTQQIRSKHNRIGDGFSIIENQKTTIENHRAKIATLQNNKWYRFGQYSRKRKIWVICKVLSKKLYIYWLVQPFAQAIKKIRIKRQHEHFIKNQNLPKEAKGTIALMTVVIMKENILFLDEWLNHHYKMGANHIYLYDNSKVEKMGFFDENVNADIVPQVQNKHQVNYENLLGDTEANKRLNQILEKYKDKLTVVTWSKKDKDGFIRYFQEDAIKDFINKAKGRYEYGLHIDTDEFMISRKGLNLKDIIKILYKNRASTACFGQRWFLSRFKALNRPVLSITTSATKDTYVNSKSMFLVNVVDTTKIHTGNIHKMDSLFGILEVEFNDMIFHHYNQNGFADEYKPLPHIKGSTIQEHIEMKEILAQNPIDNYDSEKYLITNHDK